MLTDNLSPETVLKYIPNVLTEAAGEQPLAEKLMPYIDSARIWLESEITGSGDFLSDAHRDFALTIIIRRAYADAIPSLDLVVTASGFGVISTDNMAPASKERVERLISSLREYVRANTVLLLEICKSYAEWRESERGQYFCSTFLSSLSDCSSFKSSIYESYDRMRLHCTAVEYKMAEHYLGFRLMDLLRSRYNSGSFHQSEARLFSLIRAACIDFTGRLTEGNVMPDHNAMWRRCRPIVNELNYFPEYKEVWNQEMGHRFNTPGFVNNIQGGFYF